ncbi:MAG: hypothetical protein JXX28_15785 [Deltaproteobacteria bacterium]|nr:hypothetical protein [Deltaproteobacteria bacterium]
MSVSLLWLYLIACAGRPQDQPWTLVLGGLDAYCDSAVAEAYGASLQDESVPFVVDFVDRTSFTIDMDGLALQDCELQARDFWCWGADSTRYEGDDTLVYSTYLYGAFRSKDRMSVEVEQYLTCDGCGVEGSSAWCDFYLFGTATTD